MMDKEELINKNKQTKKILESVIAELKDNVELFLKTITSLHCLLLSNRERLIPEKAAQCIEQILNIAGTVNLEFKEYINLEKEYVEEATSLTAADDYTVPIIKLEIPGVFSKMSTISKIINSINYRELFSEDYLINLLSEKHHNTIIDALMIIYNNFSTLLSDEELLIIDQKFKLGKEFTEDNIEELTPSETDYKRADEDFGLYKKIIKSDDYSIPFELDDSEEASINIDGFPDEDLVEEEAAFAEPEDTHNAEPERVGGAPMIDEAAIEGLDTEDYYIRIRKKRDDETDEEYDEYLAEQYKSTGFSAEKIENRSKILSQLSPFKELIDSEKIKEYISTRGQYPHERTKHDKEIKWENSEKKVYTILSEVEGEEIYNDYEEYVKRRQEKLSDLIAESLKNVGPTVVAKALEKLTEEGSTLLTERAMKTFVNILNKEVLWEKGEYITEVSFNYNIENDIVSTPRTYIMMFVTSREDLRKLIRAVNYLNMDSSENGFRAFCDEVDIKVSKEIKNGKAQDYSIDKFLEDDKKVIEESSSLTEDDEVVDYSDEEETKPKRKTSSTKKASTKKKPLTKTGSSAVRKISKQKSDMLLLKINGIYKEVESKFSEKKLEINEENYFKILKELCENQSEKQDYKIKVINGEYYLTKQIGGNEVTMTLNYGPFLTHIQSNFDDKIKIMGYRSNLNLKGFEPEKVNTVKATIYTCLNNSPLDMNYTSLIISAYMLKRLAELGAKSFVSYSSTNDKKGYKSAKELNFAEIDGDKGLSIPLSNIDKNKPINISIFLESGKEISLELIRVNKEPEILEEERALKL